jgi:hypothetical protein
MRFAVKKKESSKKGRGKEKKEKGFLKEWYVSFEYGLLIKLFCSFGFFARSRWQLPFSPSQGG